MFKNKETNKKIKREKNWLATSSSSSVALIFNILPELLVELKNTLIAWTQ